MGYPGNDSLSFGVLRRANLKRLPMFRNARGEPAHSEPDGSDWSVADWLMATVGEVGEFANLMKKVERGDLTLDDARPGLADELADIQTYLDILAYRCGVDLGKATVDKWNRVSDRVGANIQIDNQDWHYKKTPTAEDISAGTDQSPEEVAEILARALR